jgi:hypothetical protein
MLTKFANISEIEDHIETMKILSLSKDEHKVLNKILQLENFLQDSEINKVINEELEDENWLYDTKILLSAARRKKAKDVLLIEHVKKCYNFLTLRNIEERLLKYKEVVATKEYDNSDNFKWIFNCISKQEEDAPLRWANTKFINACKHSKIYEILEEYKDDRDCVYINEKWLMLRREELFDESIFVDINSQLEEKLRKDMGNLLNISPKPDVYLEKPKTIEKSIDESDILEGEIDLF